MKCMRRPPRRLPRVLVSFGRMISVISDWVLATVRKSGWAAFEAIVQIPFETGKAPAENLRRRYNGKRRTGSQFQFRESRRNVQMGVWPDTTANHHVLKRFAW